MSGERAPALGSLNDRVELQRRQTAAEPEGGHLSYFVPIGTVWARVRAVSARQGESADGRSITVTHAVVMRFRQDIRPGDRISYRGRQLRVVSAEDLNGRRAYLSCACAETAMVG